MGATDTGRADVLEKVRTLLAAVGEDQAKSILRARGVKLDKLDDAKTAKLTGIAKDCGNVIAFRKAQADALAEVEKIGEEIKVRIGKMLEAAEAASPHVKRLEDHGDTVAKMLADVHPKCKAAGMRFEDFKKKYAPDFDRQKIYHLIRIGKGTLTIEDKRAAVAKRKRDQRAREAEAKAAAAGPAVTTADGSKVDVSKLGPDAQAKLRAAGNGEDPAASAARRMAENAKLAGDEPPKFGDDEPPAAPVHELTADEISDGALKAFKELAWEHLSKMSANNRRIARIWITDECSKLDKAELKTLGKAA